MLDRMAEVNKSIENKKHSINTTTGGDNSVSNSGNKSKRSKVETVGVSVDHHKNPRLNAQPVVLPVPVPAAAAAARGNTVNASDICYSPSRPLKLAWEECIQKGFMMVSNVFTHELMAQLTHGLFEKRTSAGRVSERWTGAVAELSNKIQHGSVINRGGRWDLPIPSYVVDTLQLNQLLQPITSLLSSIMSDSPPPRIRTHNIVLAPMGSFAQQWHADDCLQKPVKHRYFTILIHLNPIGTSAHL